PLAGRDTEEFFADARVGEFWVGRRPTLAGMAGELGLQTRDLSELADAVAKDAGAVTLRVVAEADAEVAQVVGEARAQSTEHDAEAAAVADQELSRALSTLRLVKDEWEIDQMQQACDATAEAFDAVVAELPEAVRRGRGERWVEGVFGLHARHSG